MIECILSVIIPVYNISKYLNVCIDSVIQSVTEQSEIILVDDGSTDGSSDICDNYVLKYSNISVIHKKNGGLVSARKAGARGAIGKYLTFVDGDDFVDPELYTKAIEIIQRDGFEKNRILIGSFKEYCDGKKSICENVLPSGVYDRRKVIDEVIPGILVDNSFHTKVIPAVWIKYFPTELFIQCMDQVDDVIRDGEDVLFSIACLLKTDSVRIENNLCGYNYQIISDSMSHEYNPLYYANANAMCKCLEQIIYENKIEMSRDALDYEETYMLFRYLRKEYFEKNDKTPFQRIDTLNEVIRKTIPGRKIKKINVMSMKISFLLKVELLLLQHNFIRTAYFYAFIMRGIII